MSEHFLIGGEILLDAVGEFCDRSTPRGGEVALHRVVIGEDGRRRAHFRAHVADRRLTRGGQGLAAVAEVFDDAVRAALGGEDAGDFENHVLRRRPSLQFSGELDADDLRHFQFPFHAHQRVAEVGAARADREHPEAAGRGGVRVGDEHHAAREVVVLKEDLVADAGAGGPEVKAVAAAHVPQERVGFVVVFIGHLEVGDGAGVCLHQVVADEGRGKGDPFLFRGEELNDRHRAADVVSTGAVRFQFDVVRTALEVPKVCGMIKVREHDLFSEGQGVLDRGAHGLHALGVVRIEGLDHVEVADGGGCGGGGSFAFGGTQGHHRHGGSGACALNEGAAGNGGSVHFFVSPVRMFFSVPRPAGPGADRGELFGGVPAK